MTNKVINDNKKPTSLEKSAMFSSIFANFYSYTQNITKPLNESKLFAGIMIIILNISTKYVSLNLPKPIEAYLKFTFSRNILIFTICWMGSRDILISLLLTFVFVIVMDYVLNDSSAYCCLPEGFVDYHVKKLDEAVVHTKITDPRIPGPSIDIPTKNNATATIADTALISGQWI